MDQACSQPIPFSSTSSRISSGIASTGWVSLSWMTTLSGNASQSLLRNRNRRMMSRSEQQTRKYCCLSRSSRPASVLSLGYSTLVRFSERICASTASAYRPALNRPRSNDSWPARARHSRKMLTVWVP